MRRQSNLLSDLYSASSCLAKRQATAGSNTTCMRFSSAHVLTAYAEAGHNISKTARRLGVSRNTIYRALRDKQS